MPAWDRLVADRRLVAVCYIVAAITFVNWFAHAALSIRIGGDALGTTPEQGSFFVMSHGKQTPVDERTWVRSLIYTTATMLEAVIGFPAFAFLVMRKIWFRQVLLEHDESKSRRNRKIFSTFLKVAIVFYLVWATGWTYAILRDSMLSLRAYGAPGTG